MFACCVGHFKGVQYMCVFINVCCVCARPGTNVRFHKYFHTKYLMSSSLQLFMDSLNSVNFFKLTIIYPRVKVPSSDIGDVRYFSLAAWVQDRCEIMRQDTSWQAAVTTLHRRFDTNASFQELLENAKYAPMNSSFDLVELIAPYWAWDVSKWLACWFKQHTCMFMCVAQRRA